MEQFTFCIEPFKCNFDLPMEIRENLILRRATEDEITLLKNDIDPIMARMPPGNLFEYSYEKKDGHMHGTPMEKDDWLYYVFEHDENIKPNHLSWLLGLTEHELTTCFTQMGHQQMRPQFSRIVNSAMSRIFVGRDHFEVPELGDAFINDLRALIEMFNAIETDDQEMIFKLLQDLDQVKIIASYSPFRLLSYLTILESALNSTEAYRNSERTLGYQIASKANLVNRLTAEAVNFRNYFSVPDTFTFHTVICKIYDYRNDIAHGKKSDFDNKLQHVAEVNSQVLPFIQAVAKMVVRYALYHPNTLRCIQMC